MIGFPDLNWPVIFQRFEIERECGEKAMFWKYLFRSMVFCFYENVDLRLMRSTVNSKILFYQSFIERTSSRTQFYNVQQLVESDLISYEQIRKKKLHFIEGLYLLFVCLPCWLLQFGKIRVPFSCRTKYIHSLIKFHYIKQKLRILTDINKYKLLVTFCDAYPEEAFVGQLFRFSGSTTATLQHGAFSAWREDELINSGVELRAFNSDYMLCWNKLTIEEAEKCKIPVDKMVIVGILGYVRNQPKDWKCPINRTFGVVIGHESFENENLQLIECANNIAALKGYNYYLKLHPNYDEHYFDSKVDQAHYIGNINKGIPISEYASTVDFSLVGSSSVYLELVYIGHDVIRFSSGEVTDKFKDVKLGKVVRNPKEVDVLFDESLESQTRTNELFNYLCGYKDVAGEYIKFFKRFTD